MSNEICIDVFDTGYTVLHKSEMQRDIPKLLTKMMEATGDGQAELAKRLGGKISQPNVSRWMKGAEPKGKNYQRIVVLAEILGVNDDSVNQPPKNAPQKDNHTENLIGGAPPFELDDVTSVPEMDTYGGAGRNGGFNQEENDTDRFGTTFSRDAVRANWGIPAPFLRSELHTSPGRANIVPVRGDSMNDALFAGDRAIINLDDTDVGQDGIFALLDDSASLIIKQVEVVRGSRARRIICTSRNAAYKPFELELTEPVRIIGRVVGKITRL